MQSSDFKLSASRRIGVDLYCSRRLIRDIDIDSDYVMSIPRSVSVRPNSRHSHEHGEKLPNTPSSTIMKLSGLMMRGDT